MEKQIAQIISYHCDSRKIKITTVVEEMCLVVWPLICEREDISELECLVVSVITHLNDYGVLICWGESCGKGLTYTNTKLRTYSGDFIKPEEMIEVSFMYENQCLVV